MKHRLTVEYDSDTQKLHVEGPFGDAVLFLGMAEIAKLIFAKSWFAGQQKQAIVVPPMPPYKGNPS